MKELENILRNKSKIELQVISKKIGISGWSSLSKEKLINKLVSDKAIRKRLNSELGIKINILRNPWFIGSIFLLISSFIVPFFFSDNVSKDDLNVIVDTIDKNEQYAKEIEYLEKYKRKFLEDGMTISYKVFGVENNQLVVKEQLLENSQNSTYETRLFIDFEKQLITIDLFITDLNFLNSKESGHFSLENVGQLSSFPLKEDVFYNFKTINFSGYCTRFVMLKADRQQPIFAIGVSNCESQNN
ncbi:MULTISPECIES: hypothetical protein [unclassified Maribacter]|uniref:hypothetical protein n=1 Tax=unclassified Maribacter TaxID=2615042 RepID=UPI00257FEA15|nr:MULTISPECIES: hypothetical protein [unclassified Maribacter]